VCGFVHHSFYDRKIRRVRDLSCGDVRIYLEVEIRRVDCRRCKKVKQERVQWLADNPFYTKRFSFYVGRRCRDSAITDVAKELHLDWKTVKSLEKEYMQEQLKRAGLPGPKVIGIDEISIRKGHSYRIVVSDLLRQRPIWFGGENRSEASMDLFFEELGPKKSRRIRLAVMDMWKAFENSTQRHAPQAAILYDKFHVMRHLNDALDKVRKSEYARLAGEDRQFIKGQKYTLAYLLKESFSQLWDYKREGWARRFFDNWLSSLKWQRLKPYEEFAQMIERHWEGIAAYINSEEKVSLGFVEGLNNKIRVIQRRAYGLRDQSPASYRRCKSYKLPTRLGEDPL
jgi:transposase